MKMVLARIADSVCNGLVQTLSEAHKSVYKASSNDGAAHQRTKPSLLHIKFASRRSVGSTSPSSLSPLHVIAPPLGLVAPPPLICLLAANQGKSGNTQYVPQWYQSTGMDSRVEKLEADVNSLTIGQQQILDKLNELSIQFNTRASIQPTNCPPDLEGENSQAPLQSPNRRMGGTNGTSQQGSHYAPRFVKLDFPRFKGEEDTTSWFCRVNQFFEFNHTPEEDRVALASFH
ncbi:hypothetical protein LWI28_004351 [Acer negundo]|uniref:Uncharacterized protein n=1 Tax=Acer negundo TaxID=4023 RepID=A0AAD5NWF2_ACENE|nr:hypothetical protein LWI28_004351 [Acer negundo]